MIFIIFVTFTLPKFLYIIHISRRGSKKYLKGLLRKPGFPKVVRLPTNDNIMKYRIECIILDVLYRALNGINVLDVIVHLEQ